MNKTNKIIKIFFTAVIILVVALVVLFLFEVKGFFKNDRNVEIMIPKGAGAYDVAEILEKNDLVSSKHFYYLYAKVTKPEYKYGMHIISEKSYKKMTEQLCSEGIVTTISVTIPEGLEMKEIAEKLEDCGILTVEKFYECVATEEFDYWFLKDIPQREEKLEGYLFPDTYYFSGEESAHQIIDAMLKNFDEHITREIKEDANKTGLTFDEIITLASVIEREASDFNEFEKVSGVFYNRLNYVGETNGYLQSCATVQYILKERKDVLSVADTKIDSPYNTYMYPGLPIGPIASPGIAAIEAAVYPENTEYLYFVAAGDGTHYFAKDFRTHEQNIKRAGL